MSLWPSLEWKTFLDGIKVNIYAYANKIFENNDFLNDFWHFFTDKTIKIEENWKILNKQAEKLKIHEMKDEVEGWKLKVEDWMLKVEC